jgi:hypothetical protein
MGAHPNTLRRNLAQQRVKIGAVAPFVDRVDPDQVERGSSKSKRERQHDRPGEPMRRVAKGNAGKRRHDAELRDNDPAASPAQRVSE